MPHVGSGDGDDLASSDEIKVFEDEGEDEQKLSENLTDDKSSLVTEGETEKTQIPGQSYSSSKNAHVSRSDSSPSSGKSFEPIPHSIGYVVSPYPHSNGSLGSVSMANKVSMVPQPHPASPLPFMMYNTDSFAQPPPAHMGIPPVHIDPKTGIPVMSAHAFQHMTWKEVLEHQDFFPLSGIPRPPMYPLAPPGQYPHHLFSPDFAPQLQWPLLRHSPSMYPMATAGFRGSYPTTIPVSASGLPRFPPPTLIPPHPGIPTHPGFSHHAIITPGPKQEISQHGHENNRSFLLSRHSSNYHLDQKPHLKSNDSGGHNNNHGSISPNNNNNHHHNHHINHNDGGLRGSSSSNHSQDKKNKMNHIKKPLNAFMLYMKEMRAKVVAECTLKESAAINQILGRRWHSLSREEQAKYYEMARKERQLHMQLYPGWSARDNYAQNCKKKKRKKDKTHDGDGNNPKKCRARYGLDKQSSWCKPCRRKKKCIRYMDVGDHQMNDGDENVGSVESLEAPTPDSKSTLDDEDEDDNSSGSDGELAHTSSELSLSSPPTVPSDIDQKPIITDSGAILRHHHLHPNHIMHHHHHSVASSVAAAAAAVAAVTTVCSCESDSNIPQLPTPPSTDSSSAAAPVMLIVT